MKSKRIHAAALAIALASLACGESNTLTRWQAPENNPASTNESQGSHPAPLVVSAEAPSTTGGPTRIAPIAPPSSPSPLSPTAGGRISSAECAQMIDHYIELTIRGAPGMSSLGPDELQAAKEMAKDAVVADPSYQKAASQCQHDVTRSKFDCAMNAASTSAWQTCVK